MKRSNPLNELLRNSSGPTCIDARPDCEIPRELRELYQRNGFFAFESALEVFPIGHSEKSYPLSEWNDESSWIKFYQELRPSGFFFAQSVLGDQFFFNGGFYLFEPETGEISYFSESLESWAERVLDDYELLTGQPLAHEWQIRKGRIPFRSRLVPITPFVLGGVFEPDNLVAMDAMIGMRLRANLALQIKNLPDGATVNYEVV
jgi:Protein of unknown function DUF2625